MKSNQFQHMQLVGVLCAIGLLGSPALALDNHQAAVAVQKAWHVAQAGATDPGTERKRGPAPTDQPSPVQLQKPKPLEAQPQQQRQKPDAAAPSSTGRNADRPRENRGAAVPDRPGRQQRDVEKKRGPEDAPRSGQRSVTPADRTATPPMTRPVRPEPGNQPAANDDRQRGKAGVPSGSGNAGVPSGNRPNRDAAKERDRNGPVTRDQALPSNGGGDLDSLRKQRRVRNLDGGKVRVVDEPGERSIVRQGDRMYIRHSERERFSRFGDAQTTRRKDGSTRSVIERPNGVRIISIYDRDGNLLERRRRARGGNEIVIIDNRQRGRRGLYRNGLYVGPSLALAPLALAIPRNRYIVEYENASADNLYDTLTAEPVEKMERRYTVDEIRYNQNLRARLRRIDLNSVNFASGSWVVPTAEIRDLEKIATVINRALAKNPREVFLIEGHTDAVGTEEDNLTLSDRRAAAIAEILSTNYQVPPENLLVQGYGEQYLKVNTEQGEVRNRRVSIRRVTPLLANKTK